MDHPHTLFIGRTTVDAVYWLDRLPAEDTKAFAQAFHAAPGGPACNAAITHAMLGGRATLLSAVGGGAWSAVVRARLAGLGVELIDLAEGSGYETPLTTVLVAADKATRTIVNPPAATHELAVPAAWKGEWGMLPAVVLTDGFYLRRSLPLLRTLNDAGVAICLDGGSWKDGTDELTPMLTAAVCSERFVAPGTDGSADGTLRWLAEAGVPFADVTRGSRSIVGSERGRRFEIAVGRVKAVDTLAAGDVLHGAFCLYAAKGLPLEQALRRASEMATRSCEAFGIDHLAGSAE